MQQSVFHINDEHSGKMTRWIKFINALVLPFPQLPSVRVVSLGPCIGFFQMMGPWTIHFAHLSGYGPCSGLRECKLWANRATAMSFNIIPVYAHTASMMLIRWRCQTMLNSLRHKYLTLQNQWLRVCWKGFRWPEVGHTMTCLVYVSWCKEVWNHLTHSPQVKWPVRMNTISIFGILMAPPINPWGQIFWLC